MQVVRTYQSAEKPIIKNDPNKGWDAAESTFWWRMQLDNRHPSYYGEMDRKIILHGYSKKIGKRERKDKWELCLKNVIFLIKEYSCKCLWITYHAKQNDAINIEIESKGGDPTIMIINQNEPPQFTEVGGQMLTASEMQFILRLWKEHKNGIDINVYKPS